MTAEDDWKTDGDERTASPADEELQARGIGKISKKYGGHPRSYDDIDVNDERSSECDDEWTQLAAGECTSSVTGTINGVCQFVQMTGAKRCST